MQSSVSIEIILVLMLFMSSSSNFSHTVPVPNFSLEIGIRDSMWVEISYIHELRGDHKNIVNIF